MAEQPRFAGIEFPLRPMIAVTANQLPHDRPGGWAFEPKFDGFHCVAFRGRGWVAFQSRRQRPLGRYFPEIVEAVTEVTANVVLDGEVVVWRDGHLNFAALQQRLHPSADRARRTAVALPACFVVFDLLAPNKIDLRARPFCRRRRALEKLLVRHLPDQLTLMPMTTDAAAAQLWMVDHCAAGIEGVVAERLNQAYRPGDRTWRGSACLRAHHTAVAVGPLDDQRAPAARGFALRPRTIWSSFGQLARKPVAYTKVTSRRRRTRRGQGVIEDFRWCHACRFVRIRRDLKAADLPARAR
jgi:ATP dependent DNA ligase domain